MTHTRFPIENWLATLHPKIWHWLHSANLGTYFARFWRGTIFIRALDSQDDESSDIDRRFAHKRDMLKTCDALMHQQIWIVICHITLQAQNPDSKFVGVRRSPTIHVFFDVQAMGPQARIPIKKSAQSHCEWYPNGFDAKSSEFTTSHRSFGYYFVCPPRWNLDLRCPFFRNRIGPNPSRNCLQPPKEVVQFDYAASRAACQTKSSQMVNSGMRATC